MWTGRPWGTSSAKERPRCARLLDRIEAGDAIAMTTLDRLGRGALDVAGTIRALGTIPVQAHCLALPGVDLTRATGSPTIQGLNAVAQFERDLLAGRRKPGSNVPGRRASGSAARRLCRPQDRQRIAAELDAGVSVAALARMHKISRTTVAKMRDSANNTSPLGCFDPVCMNGPVCQHRDPRCA